MIKRFHELSRDEKIHLNSYIMRRFAEEKGIPIAEHHRDIDTDMHKVIEENKWTIKEIWKRQKEFFWFSPVVIMACYQSSLKTIECQ